MPETIIRFVKAQDSDAVSFYLAKPNVPPSYQALTADPAQPPFAHLLAVDVPAGAVSQVGIALYQELLTHGDIKDHFKAVFADTAMAPPRSIGMHVESARADSLPWETLCRIPGEFLSLDRRWPVVRMLDPTDEKLRQDYEYFPPLRIAAVLTAWGSTPDRQIPADKEWKSIENGFLAAPAGTCELMVLVCEPALKQKIDQAAHAGVRAELVESQAQLSREIRNFKPHILHFFCHGFSGDKSFLRITTALDQISDKDGSIYLRPGDLRQDIDAGESVWLVVLNCCDGANASRSGDTRSLAAALVKAGFPAVIGMREPVDSNHARLLTEAFYSELVPKVDQLPLGALSAIEWAELLVGARKNLSNQTAPPGAGPDSASSTKQWAIPALYMRTLAFRMRKLQPKLSDAQREEISAKLAELRELRMTAFKMPLSAGTKQQMLAEFDHQIAAEEAKLL